MLKITTQIKSGLRTFFLEGKLAGPWVDELARCWRPEPGPGTKGAARVDLSSVTFIDEEGKKLLEKMYREGVELVASGCLNRCIVEGIIQSVNGRS